MGTRRAIFLFALLCGASAGGCAPVATGGAWKLTIYVTAVEDFHHGSRQTVLGCKTLECKFGREYLGHYPATFVKAVKDQGTGRITSGAFARQFLNWSIDVGYWLDRAPRDARGGTLQPWVSAAADPSVPMDTHVTIAHCGVDLETGNKIDERICKQLRAGRWIVRDRFTVGKVGRWLDLYIGDEHGPGHAESPFAVSTRDAKVVLDKKPPSTPASK